MENTSYLELSESALKTNLKFIRRTLCKNSKLSCVVKGNAYGHGIHEFTSLLVKHGIKHISVFSSYEAFQVQETVKDRECDIMIMGDIPDSQMDEVIECGMEFFVFDVHRLELAIERARVVGKKARVHLEVETGMNRLGLTDEGFARAIELVKENADQLELEGICTHFAGAESVANHMRVKSQIKRFKQAVSLLEKSGLEAKRRHCACSAAALRFPKTRMDMVRVGIMAYGFWPSEECYIEYLTGKKTKKNPLSKVLTWKSRVMGLKKVAVGEFIGYGTTYLASENKNLALVPVGYSNGFARSLSNSGRVIVREKQTQVVGTVNMNAIAVDVTHHEEVKVGDEVVLIGSQGEYRISVASFADITDQLNYEVLTRLPKDLKRHVVE